MNRKIQLRRDGVWIDGEKVPANSPGLNFIDGDLITDNDFLLGDEVVLAGSPMIEVFAAYDRWRIKNYDPIAGKPRFPEGWPTEPGDGEGEGGPMIEPADGEAAERISILNPDDPGSFAHWPRIDHHTITPHMDFTDRLEVVEPLPDAPPYVAGESGKVAVFRFGQRRTDWYDDPAEAMEAYEHDPDFAFDEILDVADHVTIPLDDLVEICAEFLGNLGCTLWADFDISRNSGRERGARWLAEQIQGVAKIAAEDHG